MIVSKPQASTLSSFGIFLILSLGLFAFNLFVIVEDPFARWYNYLIIVILGPICLFIFYKMVIQYKIILAGNNQIEIRYPVKGKTKMYPLKDLDEWGEYFVKTGKTSQYKELLFRFRDGTKITLGHREYTNYDQILKYLTKKVQDKQKNQTQ